jgi:hypothetical protein
MLPNMAMLSMLHVLCVEGALSLRFDVVVYVLTNHLQRKFWVWSVVGINLVSSRL